MKELKILGNCCLPSACFPIYISKAGQMLGQQVETVEAWDALQELGTDPHRVRHRQIPI